MVYTDIENANILCLLMAFPNTLCFYLTVLKIKWSSLFLFDLDTISMLWYWALVNELISTPCPDYLFIPSWESHIKISDKVSLNHLPKKFIFWKLSLICTETRTHRDTVLCNKLLRHIWMNWINCICLQRFTHA